jgi:hypothetical protein
MDRDEMSNLYRGPYIDAYCQVWFHLAKLFQRRRLNQRLSRVNIGPYEKNVSKHFFSETTRIIDTKLPRNDHWKVLYKVCVIGSNVKLSPAVAAILSFISEQKT